MKLRLETARLLTYRAAWLKDQGKPAMLDAALANLHLGESFLQNSLEAVRIHGARGYLTEFEVERDFRDAMGGPIYGGTSDIQRNIIARLMGL
jgi:alkylation response protein AidB-like acyl-CoA dehydrogenase